MKKIIIIVSIIGVVIAGIVLYPKFQLYLNGNLKSNNTNDVEFYISKNTTLSSLAENLLNSGVIDNKDAFISVGEYKKIDQSNLAEGKYVIHPGTSYKNLLNGFKKNSKGNGNAEVTVQVSFNNCGRLEDLVKKLHNQIAIDTNEFLTSILQIDYKQEFGLEISKEQIPSLIFPNTYDLYYDTEPKEFMQIMVKEYKTFWTKNRLNKMKKIGLSSPSEVSTLASIVYAEQNQIPDEWPKIAAVYLNRLKNTREFPKLESCPTVRFCDPSIKGQPSKADVQRNKDNPYNTYTHQGLPPGPINMPARNVIDSVLNRSEEKYVYMCARPDYSHRNNFSTSLSQHNRYSKDFWNWYIVEQRKKSK